MYAARNGQDAAQAFNRPRGNNNPIGAARAVKGDPKKVETLEKLARDLKEYATEHGGDFPKKLDDMKPKYLQDLGKEIEQIVLSRQAGGGEPCRRAFVRKDAGKHRDPAAERDRSKRAAAIFSARCCEKDIRCESSCEAAEGSGVLMRSVLTKTQRSSKNAKKNRCDEDAREKRESHKSSPFFHFCGAFRIKLGGGGSVIILGETGRTSTWRIEPCICTRLRSICRWPSASRSSKI